MNSVFHNICQYSSSLGWIRYDCEVEIADKMVLVFNPNDHTARRIVEIAVYEELKNE